MAEGLSRALHRRLESADRAPFAPSGLPPKPPFRDPFRFSKQVRKVNSANFAPGLLSEVHFLRVALLLYHRLRRLGGGYRVGVPMHHLPLPIFGSEDHRNPQGARSNVLSCADLALRPLYPHDVG